MQNKKKNTLVKFSNFKFLLQGKNHKYLILFMSLEELKQADSVQKCRKYCTYFTKADQVYRKTDSKVDINIIA